MHGLSWICKFSSCTQLMCMCLRLCELRVCLKPYLQFKRIHMHRERIDAIKSEARWRAQFIVSMFVLQDDDYGFLLINFKSIANILTDKLEVLRDLSFDSASSLLFGFSFGARLIVKAATDFGPKQIGNIHRKKTFEKHSKKSYEAMFILLFPIRLVCTREKKLETSEQIVFGFEHSLVHHLNHELCNLFGICELISRQFMSVIFILVFGGIIKMNSTWTGTNRFQNGALVWNSSSNILAFIFQLQCVKWRGQVSMAERMLTQNWLRSIHNVFIPPQELMVRVNELVIKIGWWAIVASHKLDKGILSKTKRTHRHRWKNLKLNLFFDKHWPNFA